MLGMALEAMQLLREVRDLLTELVAEQRLARAWQYGWDSYEEMVAERRELAAAARERGER